MSLPRAFRAFSTAAFLTNLGDGARLSGGPLLVASVTADPLLVGTAVFFQQIPWLVLSPAIGVWADRVDRARLLTLVASMRALLAGGVVTMLLTGTLGIAALLVALFTAGALEVAADTAGSSLVVELVSADDLDRANARLYTVFVVGNQMAGPAIGALLFAAGPVWPFVVDGVVLTAAAAVLTVLAARRVPAAMPERARHRFRADLAEGARAILTNPPIRLLALLLAVMNVTFSAAFASWVLYASRTLGVPAAAFGLLVTCSAIGGLVGGWVATPLLQRFGAAVLLRGGLLVEASILAVLGLTQHALIAGAMMLVFGCHAAVWGIVATTARQRGVPLSLQGRVASFYGVLTMGGSAVGALLGGAVASATTLSTPFVWAAIADFALAVVAWRVIGRHFGGQPARARS